MKIIGDHEKVDQDGSKKWELGVFYYEQCARNKKSYKIKDDVWWYIADAEIQASLPNPVEEKLSGFRKVFYFSDLPSGE